MKKIEKELGKIVHWYDKINVAVIRLSGKLSVGDRIKVKRHDSEFEETVSSMQLDHKDIASGKKGQEIAVKFSNEGHDGAVVFKVE
ncbi:MAG: translation elongation factor-like protein [Patescibacteria group bacterium]